MMKLKRTLLSKPLTPWSFPVVGATLLLMLGMSILHWSGHPIANAWTANGNQVFHQHEYYRLFTTLAMHADIRHFLGNALFFGIFGVLLYSYVGWFWFPFLSVVFGAIINALTIASYPADVTLMGASGVVYFMAGAWATLFYFIERKSHWMKRAVAAVGVSLILFFPEQYEPEVSYSAHAIGFALGMMVASLFFLARKNAIRKHEYWEIDWNDYFSQMHEHEHQEH